MAQASWHSRGMPNADANPGSDLGLRWATLGALALVVLALIMNTCAMDRLETQVIRQTRALEGQFGGGSSGQGLASRPAAGAATATSRIPGTGTGFEAVGWGGRRAEILHVEGAAPDAPLTISQKPRPQGDTYVNRRSSPPSSLNYYATSEGETQSITQYVISRLIGPDLDAPPGIEPGIARSWQVSDDKLTYTYALRKGVQFADGRPFTSADVLFSFEVMRDPAVNAQHMRPVFEDVESVEAPDAHTVVVKYRKKHWLGLYAVGYDLRILNKGWYEEQIPAWAERLGLSTFATEPGKPGFGEVFNRMTIPCPGTGPYYFTPDTYDKNKSVELRQNPFYWGIQGQPTWYNVSGLRWIFISDEIAAMEEFRKGNFDVTVVEFEVYDNQLRNDPTITSIAQYYEYDHIGLGWSEVTWNNRRPPFDDPRVRKAMAHLLDREYMVDEVQAGRGSVPTSPTKRIYPSYSQDLVPWKYDIEEARRLLAEAGWKDSDGDGVLDRDGKRFEFELKLGSQRRFYVQLASALQEGCAKVGIRMTPRTLEWATFIEDFQERRFDAASLVRSFPAAWIDPSESYHSANDVPRGGNDAGWHSDEADRILDAMKEEFDEAKRTELWHQFNRIFHEEQPVLLVTHSLVGVLSSNRFEDQRVRPTGLRMEDFWVKPENVRYK